MNRYASFKVFSLLYGPVYMALFWVNEFYGKAMFRYYPVLGGFYRERQPPETAGQFIVWYFWLFGAFVVSVALSLIVPRKWADRIPNSWIWIASTALVVATLVYERRWFY